MVGGCIADDWNFMPQTINLVLFGKTGNGKSASGNSILGRNAFVSKPSLFGATSTCELQSTKLKDGRILNVIDTPGTSTQRFYSTCKRIVECVDLVKDGIHAVLAVFSVRSRHSTEEDAAIENLKNLFGETILKYRIVVFTGGDDLESSGLSLEEFIGQNMHRSLQKFIQSCNRRIILFDNKTCDEGKRGKQLEVLMDNVDTVLADNSGKPFSDYIFDELKEGALILHQREKEIKSMKGCSEQQLSAMKKEIYKSYHDHFAGITEKVEQKLKQTVEELEKRLAEEQAARHEAEKNFEEARLKYEEARLKYEEARLKFEEGRLMSEEARSKSDEEIRNLNEKLEQAQRESEEFRKRVVINKTCAIL